MKQMYQLSGVVYGSTFNKTDGPDMLIDLLSIDKKSNDPIYLQLTKQIAALISNGKLVAGSKIPGSRAMATHLAINRKTVIAAIDQLVIEGWLTSRLGNGTFVSEITERSINGLEMEQVPPLAPATHIPEALNRNFDSNAYCLRLDDGLPDPRLAPIQEYMRAYKNTITQGNLHRKFGYDSPEGSLFLRKELAKYLKESRNIDATEDQIVVTRGVTQALYLAIKAFVQPDDYVVVSSLNWESANANFKYHGARLLYVDIDEDGVVTEHLEQLLKEYPVKMIYLTPHHQYPTTVIMPAARRLHLLTLAQEYGVFVFEDDYDFDFHYSAHAVMPLASTHHGGYVLYAGSFTKALSPAFRVGYLVMTTAQARLASAIRRVTDRQGDPFTEDAIALLLKEKVIHRSLRRNRKIYEGRRNYIVEALRQNFEECIQFKTPMGGMSIWATFDERFPIADIAQKAKKQSLYLTNGHQVGSNSQPINATRLGFASSDEREIAAALEILTRIISKY